MVDKNDFENLDLDSMDTDALREAFKRSVPKMAKKDANKSRFEYTRKKKSQGDNSISNVVTFKDHLSERKYIVSVNASVDGAIDDDILLDLQKHISAFLSNIHEKL